MNEWLGRIAFSIGRFDITNGNILASSLLAGLLVVVYMVVRLRLLPRFFHREEINEKDQRRIGNLALTSFLLLFVLLFQIITKINYTLFENQHLTVQASNLLLAIFLWEIARIIDLMVSKTLIHDYYESRARKRDGLSYTNNLTRESTQRMVQYVVYILMLLLMVRTFEINYTLFPIRLGDKTFDVRVSSILTAFLILAFARLINWVLSEIVLFRYYNKRKIDLGSQYAMNRLLSYFIYIMAMAMALQSLGINLLLVWGSLAALLLGVGLGLQQTFNDLASGLILLFERTVEVGDVVLVEGEVGIVKQIGLRTSLIETRNSTTIIVPNSKLIVETVANWSHTDNVARFQVQVGVAYGSDTQLVKKLLIEIAKQHPKVLETPPPIIRFIDFADSSLNFELHFWSQELFRIEDVKSDLRFEIDRAFRENNVSIPFPQRDVWLRNSFEK